VLERTRAAAGEEKKDGRAREREEREREEEHELADLLERERAVDRRDARRAEACGRCRPVRVHGASARDEVSESLVD
jgi:hypothetical protein